MENLVKNLVLMTDSYKLTHWKQYPNGMKKVYSYLESRGGLYPKTMFFGLQYYLKNISGNVITEKDVNEADKFSKMHFGHDLFNKEGWMYIVKRHGGKLPLRIKAVKEGTLVKNGNVLMTIENTDDNCYWLTNVMETYLMKIWYTISIATNSFYSKKTIGEYLLETAENLNSLPFKLHDFGYRGVSSEETAGLGGMAHLVNFLGTDTVGAIIFANKYYNECDSVLDENFKMYAYSVPASEHSVACSYGKDKEEEYFLTMIEQYPEGIVSIVSDTYNVFNFVETMSDKFKSKILSRKGSVVFRPDSGDPIEVNLKLINLLWNRFGGSFVNGYKILDPHVRLIQGDGIEFVEKNTLKEFLKTMVANGWSADNWVFGSGGGLLQKINRDTQKFAIKASWGEREVMSAHGTIREGFGISKDPITSNGKRSKAGMLKLHPTINDSFSTVSSVEETQSQFAGYIDALELVFENGEVKRFQSFDDVRNIAKYYLEKELLVKELKNA